MEPSDSVETMTTTFSQRPATLSDLGWLERLREQSMRAELEALGRWDPRQSRLRIEDALRTADVRIIKDGHRSVGSIAWTRAKDGWRLHLFYLDASARDAGLGSAILTRGLAEHPGTVRLVTLIGSRARALYERVGFRFEFTQGVDEHMVLVR